MKKQSKKKFNIPMPPTNTGVPDLPLQEFNDTPEIFKDPKGIIFDENKKRLSLKKIEEAYLQAWMSQKAIEITYQRFLHDTYDKTGLLDNALKSELMRTQNEIKIAEGILNTIKDWYGNL